jgi:ABC-type Na+ transport system ATPase subunit NatA
MNLIELTEYSFISNKTGRPFQPFNFFLAPGDTVSVSTDSADDALSLLKALATLIYPLRGEYRYRENRLDFSNYRNLLDIKKNIGFVTSHSALISNLTVRENLLLMNAYFMNSFSKQLNHRTQELCEMFSLEDKLELRPAALTEHDYHFAVTVKELIKKPALLLMEYPEKFVGIVNLEIFNTVLSDMLSNGMCAVFLSEYQDFIETFSRRELVISKGTIQEIRKDPRQQRLEGSRINWGGEQGTPTI